MTQPTLMGSFPHSATAKSQTLPAILSLLVLGLILIGGTSSADLPPIPAVPVPPVPVPPSPTSAAYTCGYTGVIKGSLDRTKMKTIDGKTPNQLAKDSDF